MQGFQDPRMTIPRSGNFMEDPMPLYEVGYDGERILRGEYWPAGRTRSVGASHPVTVTAKLQLNAGKPWVKERVFDPNTSWATVIEDIVPPPTATQFRVIITVEAEVAGADAARNTIWHGYGSSADGDWASFGAGVRLATIVHGTSVLPIDGPSAGWLSMADAGLVENETSVLVIARDITDTLNQNALFQGIRIEWRAA